MTGSPREGSTPFGRAFSHYPLLVPMPATRECPSCALEFEDTGDVERCPYCDYEFPQRRSSVRWVAWLLALLLLWPAIKGLMYLLG